MASNSQGEVLELFWLFKLTGLSCHPCESRDPGLQKEKWITAKAVISPLEFIPHLMRGGNDRLCYCLFQISTYVCACYKTGRFELVMKNEQYSTDCRWMRAALEAARKAGQAQEVPIGAVVVANGQLVSAAANARQRGLDPLGHAEIIVLGKAAKKLGSRYLNGCSLYVTLEPCAMCAGAIVLARIERLIYAADDPKAGACGSLYNIPQDARLNHHVAITRGILADEAGQLLSDFFKSQRSMNKK